jgi:peptide/nickel transport system permease protein
MLRFLLSRVAAVLVVLVGVATITWMMMHLLYPEPWAFDTRPLLTQFVTYLGDAARLDFGISWDQQRNEVSALLARGLPADLWLLAGALVVGSAAGLAAGAFCAAHPRALLARVLDALAALLIIAPVYWVGLMLLLLFADGFGFIPIGFIRTNVYESPFVDPLRFLQALWLPWLVLGAPLAALVQRMTKASMTDTLDEDFLRTARAKGLGETAVLRRHALPAAASPVMTLVATQMAVLVTNLVLVETVFSVPGAYQDITGAMADGNFPLLQGLTLGTAAMVVLASLLVDLLQAWLDPTVRET